MGTRKQKFDLSAENFDLLNLPEDEKVDSAAISLWLPLPYKEKFARLQKKSHLKFGRFIKQVVIKQIDSVKIED